jgi:hypothetical protein
LESTVRQGNRLKCWKTTALSREGPTDGTPPISTSPSDWCKSPATIRSRVVLPHPLGPSRQTNWPAGTERSIPSIAGPEVPAKVLEIPRISTDPALDWFICVSFSAFRGIAKGYCSPFRSR